MPSDSGPSTRVGGAPASYRQGMTPSPSPRVLVVFHSSEGQTEKIADRIVRELERHGALVTLREASSAPAPDACDIVVVGDSIHTGRHSRQLTRWLERHERQLASIPVALFQVSLTSANDDEEHAAEATRMVQEFLDQTALDPVMVGLFAGALKYTRYGWLKRAVMKRIAAAEGSDTDTSRDHEYTDWDTVDEFAHDVLSLAKSEMRPLT